MKSNFDIKKKLVEYLGTIEQATISLFNGDKVKNAEAIKAGGVIGRSIILEFG